MPIHPPSSRWRPFRWLPSSPGRPGHTTPDLLTLPAQLPGPAAIAVGVADGHGRTPLAVARAGGHEEVAQLLIEAGAER
jgi:hypothetical protein